MLMGVLKGKENSTLKMHRLVEKGELIPIIRGLYETYKISQDAILPQQFRSVLFVA